jgi:hypothetical protein
VHEVATIPAPEDDEEEIPSSISAMRPMTRSQARVQGPEEGPSSHRLPAVLPSRLPSSAKSRPKVTTEASSQVAPPDSSAARSASSGRRGKPAVPRTPKKPRGDTPPVLLTVPAYLPPLPRPLSQADFAELARGAAAPVVSWFYSPIILY